MGKNNIETLKEFQTSINIGFDLYDDARGDMAKYKYILYPKS